MLGRVLNYCIGHEKWATLSVIYKHKQANKQHHDNDYRWYWWLLLLVVADGDGVAAVRPTILLPSCLRINRNAEHKMWH